MFSGAKPGADADGPDAQISDLFGRLASACEDQSHKRALKVCEDLLKLTPGDFDASHAKVVALIELGRYADTVAFLEEGDAQLRVKLSFELAYALYRSNRLTDALAKLDEIGNGDGDDDDESKKYAALQLKAQLLYRVGRSGESVSLYNDLFTRFPTKTKECSSSAVNLTAALVAAGCSDKILQALKKIGTTPKASFELAFNVACGLLVSGEFHDATQYLQLAKTLGESTLHDEGLSGDEIKHELAPIDAQLAFCEAELGRTELATDLYKKVLSLNGSDAATKAVCVTNLAVLVGPRGEGGTELMKKVEKLTDGEGNVSQNVSTLSSIAATKKALVHNRAVTLVHGNRLEMVKASLESVTQICGGYVAAALEVAVASRERRPKDAFVSLENALKDAVAAGDKLSQRDALLTIAQLHATSGEFGQAVESLKKAGDTDADGLKTSPAFVATIAALFDLAGDSASADSALDEMLARVGTHTTGVPCSATLRAADRSLRRGRPNEALVAYEKLVTTSGITEEEAQTAIAGVVKAAAAGGDLQKAETFSKNLVAMKARHDKLDPDLLEESLPASVVQRSKELLIKEGSRFSKRKNDATGVDGNSKAESRKRKKKKVLLPKGFDPEKTNNPLPDPERWLPKRERSYFKGKKKKLAVRGAQGAAHMTGDLKLKEFSGGAGGGDVDGISKTKPGGLDPSIAEKLLGKGKGKKKKGGKR